VDETVAYLIEILIDDLGLDEAEAVETLADAIIVIANQAEREDLLETAANILADA
jgi:hypothetical protein